jgi:chromosome segregation ATPase
VSFGLFRRPERHDDTQVSPHVAELLRLTRENHELDATVRRVRAWNTALLHDKQVLVEQIAQGQTALTRALARLDEASGQLVQSAQARQQAEQERDLAQAEAAEHEAELRRMLEQHDALSQQLARLKARRR